jgi:hypothetical protein
MGEYVKYTKEQLKLVDNIVDLARKLKKMRKLRKQKVK